MQLSKMAASRPSSVVLDSPKSASTPLVERLREVVDDEPRSVLGVLDYWLGACDDVYPPRTAPSQN